MAREKRDDDRLPLLGDLRGEIMVFEPMLVKDLSRGGATIETRFPLQIDSLHDLRLALGSQSVVVKARVVHCRLSDVDPDLVVYRSGVQFVEPAERIVEAIGRFLESTLEERNRPIP